jgi:hypothetical protein
MMFHCGRAVKLICVIFQYYSLKTAFFAVGCLMTIASFLQISLVSEREWLSLFSRVDQAQNQFTRVASSLGLSFSTKHPGQSDASIVSATYRQFDVSLWESVASKAKEE